MKTILEHINHELIRTFKIKYPKKSLYMYMWLRDQTSPFWKAQIQSEISSPFF